jgi:5-methylcytosine-specific restriction enzyme A
VRVGLRQRTGSEVARVSSSAVAVADDRLHHTKAWRRRARLQLRIEPLCRMCADNGRIEVARIADHITPYRGDPLKFWTGQLQSLCVTCHVQRKASVEKRGYDKTIGDDGFPVDQEKHPFWKASR